MTAGYLTLAGGYEFARLRVGASLRSPDGREVYFQPGDDADSFLETVDALDELDGIADEKRAAVVDMALGEYFS